MKMRKIKIFILIPIIIGAFILFCRPLYSTCGFCGGEGGGKEGDSSGQDTHEPRPPGMSVDMRNVDKPGGPPVMISPGGLAFGPPDTGWAEGDSAGEGEEISDDRGEQAGGGREEHEYNDQGGKTRTTRYDENGNRVSETTYHEDGKTPMTETEFYGDGSEKKVTNYNENGHATNELEYWPAGEEGTGHNVKTSTSYTYDEHGRQTGGSRTEFAANGNTVYSETRNADGSRSVSKFNPATGNMTDHVTTHSSGHTRSDTRYDNEGRIISERTYREDGRPQSTATYDTDGRILQKQEFHEDGGVTNTVERGDTTLSERYDASGRLREQTQRTVGSTKTTTYRQDGTKESEGTSDPFLGGSHTDYDQSGKPTFEKSWEQGMDTQHTYHQGDGSVTRTDFNPDGSVKSQTQISPDGSPTTTNYTPGQYFEGEGGKITHNP